MEWDGRLSCMTHEIRETKTKNLPMETSQDMTWPVHSWSQRTYTFTNNRHRNFEKPPWLPRIPYAHVIPRDIITINSPKVRATLHISCVACNTPHFLCWPQSTCSPCAIHVLLININYFNQLLYLNHAMLVQTSNSQNIYWWIYELIITTN